MPHGVAKQKQKQKYIKVDLLVKANFYLYFRAGRPIGVLKLFYLFIYLFIFDVDLFKSLC